MPAKKKTSTPTLSLDDVTFDTGGMSRAVPKLAQFCDVLTGRSSDGEPYDAEGVPLGDDIALARIGDGYAPFALCLRIGGQWHVVSTIPAHDPGTLDLRAKGLLTTTETSPFKVCEQRRREREKAERKAAEEERQRELEARAEQHHKNLARFREEEDARTASYIGGVCKGDSSEKLKYDTDLVEA